MIILTISRAIMTIMYLQPTLMQALPTVLIIRPTRWFINKHWANKLLGSNTMSKVNKLNIEMLYKTLSLNKAAIIDAINGAVL